MLNIHKPQFDCSQGNDLYTTSSTSKGNQSLENPIGLITVDEISYAGGLFGSRENSSYYLYTGTWYWTMSPAYFDGSNTRVGRVNSAGYMNANNVNQVGGIRPVINLKSTVTIENGNGTKDNPYVIKTN